EPKDSSRTDASPESTPVAAPERRIEPQAPPRTRIVSIAVIGALALTAIVFRNPLVAWFTGSSTAGSTSQAAHVSTGRLTPLGGESQAAAGAAGSPSDVSYYTCSMHPAVHAHEPGKCPICSMDLTPVTREQEQAGVIHIEDSRRALLGIRTARVAHAPIDLTITAKGRLVVDETRLHEVTLKVGGYISDLHLNATGQSVTRGATLFTLYSPELYAAEQEYLIARQNQDAMHINGDATHSERLVRAAETKLRLWGISDDQLAALAKGGEPIERVPF